MGLVQSSGKRQQDNMPAASVTFNAAANFTPGNTVIITVANFTSAGITGITVSGTAAVLDSGRADTGGQNRTQIWRASNVAGGSSAVIISAAAGNFVTCGFDEWDNIALTTPLDASGSTGDTTSASPSATTSATTTQADEVVYAVFTDYAGSVWTSATPPAGYTEVWEEPDGSAHSGGSAAYRVISSTGVQTATFTTGASMGWIAAIAAYKLAGGGGGVEPVLSSPTATSVTSSGATIGATSDAAGTTFYAVIGTSATPPSAAQIKAASGGGIVGGASVALTSGANAVAVSGGASSTLHYGYAVATNGVGDSNVVSTSSFTTTAVAPAVSSVSTATPQNGASLTITGTTFGATQGSGGVTLGGVAQTVTSWGDTSITITVARGTNKLGAALGLVVTSGATGISSPTYTGVTGIAAATGWAIVNLATPDATASKRLTTTAVDLASGDQIHHNTSSGGVTVATDGTFVADAGVTSFAFEAWSPGLGWGTQGTQTL